MLRMYIEAWGMFASVMASYQHKKENDSERCKIGIRREENKGRIRRDEPMIRRDKPMIRRDAFFLEPIPVRQIIFYTCYMHILLRTTTGNTSPCNKQPTPTHVCIYVLLWKVNLGLLCW